MLWYVVLADVVCWEEAGAWKSPEQKNTFQDKTIQDRQMPACEPEGATPKPGLSALAYIATTDDPFLITVWFT